MLIRRRRSRGARRNCCLRPPPPLLALLARSCSRRASRPRRRCVMPSRASESGNIQVPCREIRTTEAIVRLDAMPFARPTAIAIALLALSASVARSQPVTFEDLRNTTIETRLVYAQTARRLLDNKVYSNRFHHEITIRIGAVDEIAQAWKVKFFTLDGKPINHNDGFGGFILNKPRKGRSGDLVWLFEDEKLTRLETYESGGRRTTLTFKRKADGLDCRIESPFVLEEGAKTQRVESPTGAGPIEIISIKPISSNCSIAPSKKLP